MYIRHFLRSLAVSAVIGPVIVILIVSLANLIYAGVSTEFLARGIGLTLVGTLIFHLAAAVSGTIPGLVALPQDNPAAILGLAAAGIIGAMAGTATQEHIFATIVAAVVLSSLLTGLLFIVLGTLRLGSLVRYLPYPVVGGFLAGTGTLIVQGALRSMTGLTFSWATIPLLFQMNMVALWLPGLLLGLVLTVVLRRYNNFLLLPTILGIAIALFYLFVWIGGIPLAEARAHGLLMAALPSETLWQPLSPRLFAAVDWQVLWAQMGTIIAIPILCTVAILLNNSGFELVRRSDIDFNHELRIAGIANLLSGLGGSHPGYIALSISALVQRLHADTRLTSLLIALIIGGALYWGTAIIAYIPQLLLSGLLLCLGFSFMLEWLYDTWFRFSKIDYLVLVAILVAIIGFGMLAGVALGTVLAVIIFVVDYSRVDVVRRALSGVHYHSNVDRPPQQRSLLTAAGDSFHIFELQGFLFFGTANRLLEQVRQRIETPDLPKLQFILLDFEQIKGLDASAVLSFVKLKQLTARHDILLIFTDLAPTYQARMRNDVLTEDDRSGWRLFADLDHGVEWCEEELLATASTKTPQANNAVEQLAMLLSRQLAVTGDRVKPSFPSAATMADAQRLLEQMERCELAPGDYAIRQAQPADGLFFLAAGQLTARLDLPDGRNLRLRTMQPGVFVGELGLYTNTAASASVTADEPSVIYYLAAEKLAHIQANHPELAAAFHHAMAQLVSERLLTATAAIEALKR